MIYKQKLIEKCFLPIINIFLGLIIYYFFTKLLKCISNSILKNKLTGNTLLISDKKFQSGRYSFKVDFFYEETKEIKSLFFRAEIEPWINSSGFIDKKDTIKHILYHVRINEISFINKVKLLKALYKSKKSINCCNKESYIPDSFINEYLLPKIKCDLYNEEKILNNENY